MATISLALHFQQLECSALPGLDKMKLVSDEVGEVKVSWYIRVAAEDERDTYGNLL